MSARLVNEYEVMEGMTTTTIAAILILGSSQEYNHGHDLNPDIGQWIRGWSVRRPVGWPVG